MIFGLTLRLLSYRHIFNQHATGFERVQGKTLAHRRFGGGSKHIGDVTANGVVSWSIINCL